MVDYQNGVIYKIIPTNLLLDEIDPKFKMYIGSHAQTNNNKRFKSHLYDYKRWLNSNRKKKFLTSFLIFDEFGVENCKMETIEKFPCDSRRDLQKKEQYYIDNLSKNFKVVNKQRAYTNIISCECGENFGEHNITLHQNSNNHLLYIEFFPIIDFLRTFGLIEC